MPRGQTAELEKSEFAMATADELSSSSRRPSRLPAAANAVLTAGSLFGAVSKVRNNSKCSAAELSTSFAEQAATRWGRKRERADERGGKSHAGGSLACAWVLGGVALLMDVVE